MVVMVGGLAGWLAEELDLDCLLAYARLLVGARDDTDGMSCSFRGLNLPVTLCVVCVQCVMCCMPYRCQLHSFSPGPRNVTNASS